LHLNFAKRLKIREAARVLTPHPGPLPIEGRGCATGVILNSRAPCHVRKRGRQNGDKTRRG